MNDSERRMILIICLIPFGGLLYCGLVIGSMLSFALAREHPLISGGIAALIPLVVGASIWIGGSARAYRAASVVNHKD